MAASKFSLMQATRLLILIAVATVLLSACVPFGPDPGVIPSDLCIVPGYPGHPVWFAGKPPTFEKMIWLPDSETLLIRNKAGKIYLVHLNEGAETLLQATAFQGHWFAYAPGTNAIAVAESFPTGGTGTRIYNLDSGDTLLSVPRFGAHEWSPDGRFLVGGLYDEDRSRVGVFDMMNPEERPQDVLGNRERRSTYAEGWSSRDEWLTIEIARATGVKIEVVEWPSREVIGLHEFEGCQESSSWTPISEEIAYRGNPDQNWDLFIEMPGMNNAQNITQSDEIHEDQPHWSPDGRSIVYVTVQQTDDQAEYKQDLSVVDVGTGNIQVLTDTDDEYEALPRWSPDGKRIAYLSARDDQLSLYTIRPNGEERTFILTILPD